MAASTHTVESTPDTVRSGYLDPAAKPVAVITSSPRACSGGYQGPGGTVAAAVTLTAADQLAVLALLDGAQGRHAGREELVGLAGFEPATSATQTRRASQAALQPVRTKV